MSESFQPHSLHFTDSGLEGFTNDVWLWFILSIDLVSITFYTIPTSISFFKEKVFKILLWYSIVTIYMSHMISLSANDENSKNKVSNYN